jgi:hypothetical protein
MMRNAAGRGAASLREKGGRMAKPASDAGRGPTERRHPVQPEPTSGTLPTASDSASVPVSEPGASIAPEDLGSQFLRDATEQDNFESSIQRGELDASDVPLGQLVSEGTLRAAGQDDVGIPGSNALSEDDDLDAELEPVTDELDLLSNSVREGSLFDQPTADGGVVSPTVNADEMEILDEHLSKRRRAEPAGGAEVLDDESEVDSDDQHDDDEAIVIERAQRK